MQEDISRGVLSIVHWLLVVVVWQVLMYGLGFATLYVISAGRWPRREWGEDVDDRISAAGLGVVLLAWTLMALHNNRMLW
jgi:hypothetical protein